MSRRRNIIILALMLCCTTLLARNNMRVHYKDGTELDIPIAQIDSVTFVEKDTPEEEVSLTGTWLWGNLNAGYYELLTFNEDYTYTGYDKYLMYGFDTMTYGWYSWYGNMLTLQSNGFGYQRIYRWFIVGLTSNALEVVTKMGTFTYYKLQPEVINVPLSDYYTGFADDDMIVFADDITVKADVNKLYGISPGTTYVLVRKAQEKKILAYEVTVK